MHKTDVLDARVHRAELLRLLALLVQKYKY